jgi:hypothetical protein
MEASKAALDPFRTVSEEVFSETELPVDDILGNPEVVQE